MEVRDQFRRLRQGEVAVHLDTVGRDREGLAGKVFGDTSQHFPDDGILLGGVRRGRGADLHWRCMLID